MSRVTLDPDNVNTVTLASGGTVTPVFSNSGNTSAETSSGGTAFVAFAAQGAVLLKASSPYSRRGVLYSDHKRHFGNDDSDVLVWQADRRPELPPRWRTCHQ